MEYPMICFNGPRPQKDGTYSARTKYGLISVIIHEVGHNYFPMIVNTDERQWTWMDEGINTFLQYLTEQEWEDNYPSRRGEPRDIVGYMRTNNQVPIMTNSESILQFGPNAYSKPATALNILRETIMGRELFDYAFKEYAIRWKFKRPMPADFFRTMEDASGIDLDWFWRGWFYSNEHVDISISGVRMLNVNTRNPKIEKGILAEKRDSIPTSNSKERNKDLERRANKYEDLKDFYNSYDQLEVTPEDLANYKSFLRSLTAKEKEFVNTKRNFYLIEFENVGGLVMPVIFDAIFEDGTTQQVRIPAEIWKQNNQKVSRLFMTEKTVKSIVLDPKLETADVDLENNYFPRQIAKSRFQLYKDFRRGGLNPMKIEQEREARAKRAKDALKRKQAAEKKAAEKKAKEKKAKEKSEQEKSDKEKSEEKKDDKKKKEEIAGLINYK
jgi:aminopeptidase N